RPSCSPADSAPESCARTGPPSSAPRQGKTPWAAPAGSAKAISGRPRLPYLSCAFSFMKPAGQNLLDAMDLGGDVAGRQPGNLADRRRVHSLQVRKDQLPVERLQPLHQFQQPRQVVFPSRRRFARPAVWHAIDFPMLASGPLILFWRITYDVAVLCEPGKSKSAASIGRQNRGSSAT